MRKSSMWLAISTVSSLILGAFAAITVDAGVTAEEAGYVPIDYTGKVAYISHLTHISNHAEKLSLPFLLITFAAGAAAVVLQWKEGTSKRIVKTFGIIFLLLGVAVVGFLLTAFKAPELGQYL